MGGQALDGCGEFMPGGREGTPEAMRCAACECHRNFHRRVVERNEAPALSVREIAGQATGAVSSSETQNDGGEVMVDASEMPCGGGGKSRGEGRPATPDVTKFVDICDLAEVARLSMQALKQNTKVMMATSESLAMLQQQRELEIQDMMAAFERAAAAIGSDLRRGMKVANHDRFDPLNNFGMDLPSAARAMDSQKSTADYEDRPSPSPDSHAREHRHAAVPSEMAMDGATSTISTPAFFSQNHIPEDFLLVQGRGGMNSGWNDGQLNMFQGSEHIDLGMGPSHQIIDSNGEIIHVPSMLGTLLRDSDAMMAERMMGTNGMHRDGEQRGDGALISGHEMYHALPDEARRTASLKPRSRSRRGRPGKAKRIRTKLTQEQKEKMELYAEKVGWTVVGQRREDVEAACADIGIAQKTLRYWLHNTKQKMKHPQINTGDMSPGLAAVVSAKTGEEHGMMMPAFVLDQEAYEGSHLWRGQFHGYDDGLDVPQGYSMAPNFISSDMQRSTRQLQTSSLDEMSDDSM